MRRGLILRVIVIQLIDNDNISIMRKAHLVKERRCNNIHGIGEITSQDNVIIQWGINDFDVNQDFLSSNSDKIIVI